MVAAKHEEFKHLSIMTMKTPYGEMYQLRLCSKLGRKTIGLGNNRIQALNYALLVDEEISRLTVLRKPVDLDVLKAIVKDAQQIYKEKTTGNLKLIEKDSLCVIWDKYVKHHQAMKAWEETYFLTHIQTVGNLIKACPVQKLEGKTELVEWLFSSSQRSPKTSKDRLKLIVAAIDWASKSGLIPRHHGIEYRDLLSSLPIKSARRKNADEEGNIDIFSVKEIYQILDALKDETYSRFPGKHKQYHLYIYFCWLTGCRPSEAIALKWENVDLTRRRIKFCEGEVMASGKLIKKTGTKTVPVRYFPINSDLMELLTSIPHRTGYVFLNSKNKPIRQHALNGVWNKLLESMGLKHRTPYQLRHTMISYHANNDFPIHKLSEIVGNSEEILTAHYLQLDIERINLPDVLK